MQKAKLNIIIKGHQLSVALLKYCFFSVSNKIDNVNNIIDFE